MDVVGSYAPDAIAAELQDVDLDELRKTQLVALAKYEKHRELRDQARELLAVAEREGRTTSTADRYLHGSDLEQEDVEQLDERELAAVRAVWDSELPLDELILTLPDYDPRAQAGDCYFDEAAALDGIEWYAECCSHIEGEWAGQRFYLEPWQKAFVANLLGWKRPDGLRRYRWTILLIPRKNGKTPLCAGLVLYLLIPDNEPGAQVYAAAGDKEQAALLYRHAKGMVENDELLDDALVIYKAGKSIEYPALGAFLKTLSADAKTKHGQNTHAVFVDELHVQPDANLVETLTSSFGTRRQPVECYMTTRDYGGRPSICNEKHDYARKVAQNLIFDPECLPVLFELRQGKEHEEAGTAEEWDDETAWRRVNPNLGVSVKIDEMRSQARRARFSTRARNTFIRLRLNGATDASFSWIPKVWWDRNIGPWLRTPHDLDRFVEYFGLEDRPCFGGLDASSHKDLSSLELLFPWVSMPDLLPNGDDNPLAGEQCAVVLPFFWCPEARVEERDETDAVSFTTWVEEGWIRTIKGNVIEHEVLRPQVNELNDRFEIRRIYYDRMGVPPLDRWLMDDGIEMIKHGQGMLSMSNPTKMLERLWLQRALVHGGHPVLAWNAANTLVTTDAAENVKPDKKKSEERIDGIVALIMALSAILDEDDDGGFAYNDRGFMGLIDD